MKSIQDFKTDPTRNATYNIRGYVYQAYQSVLSWLQLKENEILVLEGSEDFDIHCDLSVMTTQVKDVTSNLTLRTRAIVAAINHYCSCCEKIRISISFCAFSQQQRLAKNMVRNSAMIKRVWNTGKKPSQIALI